MWLRWACQPVAAVGVFALYDIHQSQTDKGKMNMPLPRKPPKFYELTRIEKAIAVFCWHEKPTQSALNMVGVEAQIQEGIDRYRLGAKKMTIDQMEREGHDSKRLGEHLAATGGSSPS